MANGPAPRLQRTTRSRCAQAAGAVRLQEPDAGAALEKIVINVGIGEAAKNPKLLDSVVEELG
jgi:ribosomal protein L5